MYIVLLDLGELLLLQYASSSFHLILSFVIQHMGSLFCKFLLSSLIVNLFSFISVASLS